MKPRAVCRLSPNEESALLHREREQRRRTRLVQVREQEKAFARTVREGVRKEREKERKLLEEHLQSAVDGCHSAELAELEQEYLSRTDQLGQAHRDAQKINEEAGRLEELHLLLAARQRWRAQDRHAAALKELTSNQLREEEARQRRVESKKQVLAAEKGRAREAISRTLQGPSLIMDLAVGRGHRVTLREVEGFSSSYYHIPSTVVQRAATPETSGLTAHQMARLAVQEDERADKLSAAVQTEQREKARLRHKHAMARVRLEKDRSDVLNQLSALEREDRTHRQRRLASMPSGLFQPVQHQVELAEEQQRDMEQAFMKLFIRTSGAPTQAVLSGITESLPPSDSTLTESTPSPLPPSPSRAAASRKTDSHGRHLREQETESSLETAEREVTGQTAPVTGWTAPVAGWTAPVTGRTAPVAGRTAPVPAVATRSSSQTPELSITDVTPSDLASVEEEEEEEEEIAKGSSGSAHSQPSVGSKRGVQVSDSSGETLPVIDEEEEEEDGEEQKGGLLRVSSRTYRGRGPSQNHQVGRAAKSGLTNRQEGMQRLVGLIRSQHEAWRERISMRARQAALHSSADQSSSDQPDSLSVYTLSSSGRDLTGSSSGAEPLISSGSSSLRPQQMSSDGHPTDHSQPPSGSSSSGSNLTTSGPPTGAMQTTSTVMTVQSQAEAVWSVPASLEPHLSITGCDTTVENAFPVATKTAEFEPRPPLEPTSFAPYDSYSSDQSTLHSLAPLESCEGSRPLPLPVTVSQPGLTLEVSHSPDDTNWRRESPSAGQTTDRFHEGNSSGFDEYASPPAFTGHTESLTQAHQRHYSPVQLLSSPAPPSTEVFQLLTKPAHTLSSHLTSRFHKDQEPPVSKTIAPTAGVPSSQLAVAETVQCETALRRETPEACSAPSESSPSVQHERPSGPSAMLPLSSHPPASNEVYSSGVFSSTLSPSSLSLQEAFLRRKQEFVLKSQARLKLVETRASERRIQTKEDPNTRQYLKKSAPKQPVLSSVSGSQNSRSVRRCEVQFSSPFLQQISSPSEADTDPVYFHKPQILSSKKGERIGPREMRKRNQRFYRRLPEVRLKRQQESRSRFYATNRNKAKQFEQKVRAKLLDQRRLLVVQSEATTATQKRKPFR